MTGYGWMVVWAGSLFTYAVWRVLNRYAPWFYGAGFSDVMWGLDEDAGFPQLLLRFVAPLLGGLLVAAVSTDVVWYDALIVGVQAGLLAVWPNVVRPDNLPWRLQIHRRAVFVLYSLFVMACGMASLLGWAAFRAGSDWSKLHLTGMGAALLVEFVVLGVLFVVRTGWTARVQVEREAEWAEEDDALDEN